MWFQKELILDAKPRGLHLITQEIVEQLPELTRISVGLIHLFSKHTSASLTINENVDPSVREDMFVFLQKLVPENESYYTHTLEGSDDMPSHIKTSIIGNNITVPITNGRLHLGTWQGIYLGEHRDYGGQRHIVVTIQGQQK